MRYRPWLLAFGPLAVLGIAFAQQPGSPQSAPDLIVHGAKVVTVDPAFSVVQAFAVRDGRFIAVGAEREVMALAGPATQVIDMQGRTVMPGFNDGHVHAGRVEDTAQHTLEWPKTIPEMANRVAAVAASAPAGTWLAFASDWHPSLLAERRFPTRAELDAAAPLHPIYIVRGGQTALLNSLALSRAGITRNTQPPEGVGLIEKDRTGEPTGLLLGNAMFLARKAMPKPSPDMGALVRSIADKYKLFNAAGITSVREAGVPVEAIRAFQEVRRRKLLTARTSVMYEPPTREETTDEAIRQIRAFGPVDGLGDEWLRIDGLKVYVDGGIESAFLREAYATDRTFFGLRNFTPEKLAAILKEASRLGWRVGAHTVGDAAADMVLDAYEAANAERSIAGRRWTIEHAILLTSPRAIERVKQLDIVISAQSWHLYRYAFPMLQYWGKDRMQAALPFKTWLERGVHVAGGSDAAPDPGPNGQFHLIWTEVTRNSEQSGVIGGAEAISREQAIRLHTQAPAYLTFEEGLKGTIERGRLADFIVISDDILTAPADRLKDLEVLSTYLGGKEVYRKAGAL